MRELALQLLSLGVGVAWNSWWLLRRSLRCRNTRVLLAGTNMMMARELRRVREVLEGSIPTTCRATLKPFDSSVDAKLQAFSQEVGAPAVHWSAAMLLPWDLIVLSCHARAFSPGRFVPKIYTGHAMSGWKIVNGHVNEFSPRFLYHHGRLVFTRMFARGEDGRRIGAESCPEMASRIAVVGDVIADEIVELDRRRDEVRASLGIGPGEFTVALLSTHGPEGLVGHYGRRFVDAAARLAPRHRVLVVNHPFHVSHRRTSAIRDLSLELRKAPPPGVRVNAPEEPIGPALVAADMVVSDHTSTALYFAQLGRPVVPLPVPVYPSPPRSPFARICGFAPVAASPEEVEAALGRAREGYPLDRLREVARDVVAHSGEARRRWRDELLDVLGLKPGE